MESQLNIWATSDDSWGVCGQMVRLHNSLWGLPDGHTICPVVGFVGQFTFSGGNVSRFTYVVESDGFYYPVRHSAIAGAIVEPTIRRRVRGAAPPRLA